MRTQLTGDRVALTPQTLAAARALLEGEDAGLLLAEGYPHADTLDGLRMSLPYATSDDELGWFVTLVADGRIIGDAGTKGGADDEGRIEIGYGLAAPFRGKGYGTEAVRLLVDHLGSQPDVRVLTAEVEVGNVASRKLLERIGFTLTHEADRSWWFERPA
ncbi:MAG: hypothetical protein QOJ60_424 [Actinomycetota bacterium]|nr:hypothetical protein [Actinomycetota bacterium]